MKYELKNGERGSFTVGGPFAGPIKLASGILLGIFGSALIWVVGRRESRWFDPSHDYFGLVVVGLVAFAFVPVFIIWPAVGNECVWLTVDSDQREIKLSLRGLFSTGIESFGFDQVEFFESHYEGGDSGVWTLRLLIKDGEKMTVGRFHDSGDAERECEEANRTLYSSRKGGSWNE